MTKVVADHHHATITTYNFALVANLFHAWFNLHNALALLVTINDSPSG